MWFLDFFGKLVEYIIQLKENNWDHIYHRRIVREVVQLLLRGNGAASAVANATATFTSCSNSLIGQAFI